MKNCWDILGIEPVHDKRTIKRAYAAKTREIHPEEKPEEFKELHEAYQAALGYADYFSRIERIEEETGRPYKSSYELAEEFQAQTADEAAEEHETAHVGEVAEKHETARGGETSDEEELISYFGEQRKQQQKRIDAFMGYWKEMKNPYQNQEVLDWWKEYLDSEEFQAIRSHPQVLHLLAEEIDDKFFYGVNDLKILFWDAYGFREGEEIEYQEDMRQLYRCLYPAYATRKNHMQYEQKWARNDKILKIFLGTAVAVIAVICIAIPVTIHRQRENGRLFLIDYVAEQYPEAAFSEPEQTEKLSDGGAVYEMRSLTHPEITVTAMVENQYAEGKRAYLVTEDYSQQLFELYAAQYGLEAGRLSYTEGAAVDQSTSVLFLDMEEVDDFCERAERMFAEQEELQIISQVVVYTKNILFPEVLIMGGVQQLPFTEPQIYDFRAAESSKISARLQEAYMFYMFQYEPWNMTTSQYREWGEAYEKRCEEWVNDDGEWHEVYDPDTGEYLCRLFVFAYQSYDSYDIPDDNMPAIPLINQKITVGNAYYYLQDRDVDLVVAGDGGGVTVESYGNTTFFGDEPEVGFSDLRRCY